MASPEEKLLVARLRKAHANWHRYSEPTKCRILARIRLLVRLAYITSYNRAIQTLPRYRDPVLYDPLPELCKMKEADVRKVADLRVDVRFGHFYCPEAFPMLGINTKLDIFMREDTADEHTILRAVFQHKPTIWCCVPDHKSYVFERGIELRNFLIQIGLFKNVHAHDPITIKTPVYRTRTVLSAFDQLVAKRPLLDWKNSVREVLRYSADEMDLSRFPRSIKRISTNA